MQLIRKTTVREAEAARVVEHVLVGRALRAAVGAVEVERPRFGDAVRAHCRHRSAGSAGPRSRSARSLKAAVDLVGRGEEHRAAAPACARAASSTLSVPCALIAKSSCGLDEAGRHRDLRREVEDLAAARRPRASPRRRRGCRRPATSRRVAMLLAQPLQVPLDARDATGCRGCGPAARPRAAGGRGWSR